MPRWWSSRRSAVAAAGLVAVLCLPGTAAAAPGTWGAGRYQYLDGTVCRNGGVTAPLAAWSVGGGHRGYLTRAVTSTGRVDSAVPPVEAAGRPNPVVDVAAGGEFGSDQDIAATAYLVGGGGDAAVIAAAVLAQTDPGGEPSCANSAAASSLIAAARLRAGPYQVSVTAGAGQARPGHPFPLTAVVRTLGGNPVPGARVRFSTPGGSFAQDAVVTDSTGTARNALSVRGSAGAAVAVTASTDVATGLREATVTAQRSATNPSGASVPAVFAAPATTFSDTTTVPVDQAADPIASTALTSHLARAGAAFVPTAQISGLNGHSADVGFNLLGPLPLDRRRLCAGIDKGAWSGANVHIAATSSVVVNGDGPAKGDSLTPGGPGCYGLRVTVATVDATPPVTRSSPVDVISVVDTTAQSDDTGPAVFAAGGSGRLSGQVQVSDTYGLRGQVRVTLTGPITPADGDCAVNAAAWTKAAHRTVTADVRGVGSGGEVLDQAGTYRYTLPAPGDVGCYRARAVVVLDGGDAGTLTAPTDADRPVYLLEPTVTAAVQRTWAVTPATVPVQVSVAGLYGLAAHVRAAMYRTAATPGGCGEASFTAADRTDAGPAVEVPAQPGIVTVSVESGPTPKVGCYAVVPEVTVDADPHVRVTGEVGLPGSTLIAGVSPNRQPGRAASHQDSGTSLAFATAMGVLGAVLLAVIARVAFVAWRERNGPVDEMWSGLYEGDPLDITDGGLPSGHDPRPARAHRHP